MTRTLAATAFLIMNVSFASAQGTFKPGKLSKEEQAALVPGLAFHFSSGGIEDVRLGRLAALHVPAGTPPSPFLKPGPFTVRLTGFIKAPIRSEFKIRLHVLGAATLSINNKLVLEGKKHSAAAEALVELSRGYNKIEIQFTSPPKGDATLRVSWSGEEFGLEPLRPEFLFTRGNEAKLAAGIQVREGRMMFGTHGCSNCHALPTSVVKGAMPELNHTPPSLEGAGSRFSPAWMTQWIINPRVLRPKATMPAVLHGEQTASDARDIAEYLSSLNKELPARPSAHIQIEQGEKLFNTLGCVACHHFNDPKDEETLERYPLYYVKAKFKDAALAAFLKAPHAHHAWSRMPDFKLSWSEAENLAAYLRVQSKGEVEKGPQGDRDRGAKLFTSAGCAACHTVKSGAAIEDRKRLPFPAAEAAQKGCLANDSSPLQSSPHYGFKKHKLEALRSFVASQGESLQRDSAIEFAQRQMANLKCTACHRRDGSTSRWYQVAEEEGGNLPENLPILSWTGEKLRPEWTKKLLQGLHDHRARPWLKARMPAFPARADLVALGLSHEHGFPPDEDNRPAPNADLAAIGAKLMPQQGGLNCVQCHGVGKQPAVAPFEAPGINLLDAAHRLRYDYYQRWMIDPPRVDITTKMPKLATDGKVTGVREVFGGDGRRQFEALWYFIQTLPGK